jgi:chemosensory pili system protein ChpA (sensor histidine kinase/response regulator)
LSPHHAPTPGQPPLLSEHELAQIRRHVITEALTTLGEIKAALTTYALEPEHSDLIAVTPELFAQIEGALEILRLERAAALMAGVGAFIRQRLLQAPQAPQREQLDTLADAITSIEYYLEALAEGRSRADAILTVAEISLEQLGCAPLADTTPPPVREVAAHAPAQPAAESTAAGEAETWAVFRAEAEEILHKTEALLEGWAREPDNPSYAGRLQQYLHTLKGAARMASAAAIADLAHAMETLLSDLRGKPQSGARGPAALLQQCQDWMAQALSAPAPDALHAPDPLLAALAGSPPVSIPDATAPQPAAVARPAAVVPARETNEDLHEIIDFIEGLTFDPAAGQHPAATAPAAGEEHIRVQAALLDELSRLAGAVGGEHARLAGQLGPLTAAVGALAQAGAERVGDLAQQLELGIGGLVTACARQGELLGQLHATLLQASRVAYASVSSRLRRTVRQACNDLRKYAELEITGAELQIDRAQLNHLLPVIEHLLRNAVAHGIEAPELRKARGKSPVGKIRLQFRQQGESNMIQLGDDGAGIDLDAVREQARQQGMLAADDSLSEQELLQLILLPGFSTAASLSQIAGRGLGLAAASSELRELGGDLTIDNHPGAGVLFTLRFPIRAAAQAAGRAGAPAQRPASVLIVDDSATVRKVTANLLQAQHYHTLVAHDGASALHILEHTTPDAILLDVEMPGMDGFALTQALKADARLAPIPIIMITSRTDEQYRRRAQELGVVSYMGKPFQEAALLATLRRYIGAHA